ncbi:zinc finger protein 644 isoform X2 [Brachyhypopomus gauderio]|uniref:zinc finger protein 644 isoform X2 n=1 Tax=Brachyhypopomus gauderio TaxID=698409 RepID=UPI0040435B17
MAAVREREVGSTEDYTAEPSGTCTSSPTTSTQNTCTSSPTTSTQNTCTSSPTTSTQNTCTSSPTTSTQNTCTSSPTTSIQNTSTQNTCTSSPTTSTQNTCTSSPTTSIQNTSTQNTCTSSPTTSIQNTSTKNTCTSSPTTSTQNTSTQNTYTQKTCTSSPTTSTQNTSTLNTCTSSPTTSTQNTSTQNTCTSSPTTSTQCSSGRPSQDQALPSHQSLLNGAQLKPFVHDGVPATPCPDDSLPPGALVNGPASHRLSEEPHVPNKDGSSWPGTGSSPQVLQPPSELQSDTQQKAEGHALEVTSTRASSGSDGESTAPAEGDEEHGPIGRHGTREGAESGTGWDDWESTGSSSDDCEGLNVGLQERFIRFLFKRGMVGGGAVKGPMEVEVPPPAGPRRRKQKMCRMERLLTEESGNRASLSDGDSDFDMSINEGHAWRRQQEGLEVQADSSPGNSRDTTDVVEELILSECAGTDGGEAGVSSGGKPAPSKRRPETATDPEPSFFQCTKCNVNFKEKRHLHRHMMYHLERHNQVGQGSRQRTFICRECGRSFCERSSLQKHMLIHQARREKLMQEIKGLIEPGDEGPDAQLRCTRCSFTTTCPERLVQHTRTHGKGERLGVAHERAADLSVCQSKLVQSFDTFLCKICTFRTENRNVLRKHLALVHKQPISDNKLQSHNMAADHTRSVYDQDKLTGQIEADSWHPLLLKPKLLRGQDSRKGGRLSAWPNGLSDLYVRDEDTQTASPLIKWSFGSLANNLSPSSLKCDKPSKLSLPTERIDVTTGLPYVEEDSHEHESSVSEQKAKYLTGFDARVMTEAAIYGKTSHLNHTTSNGPRHPAARGEIVAMVQRKSIKSPSKRKMSVPYHNTHLVLPKHEPASPEHQDMGSLRGDDYNDADKVDGTNHANQANDADYHTDTMASTSDHFVQHGFPFKTEDSCDSASQSDHDTNAEDSDDICTLIVKEESIESAVSGDNTESADTNHMDAYSSYPASPVFEIDRKSCPYCPAVFESGVGLSNHVRGHLHRMGLSYEARHMLSPEQVARQDHQPRIRRRVPSMCKRSKRDKPESQTEHTCPLCLGWFDTKTGLSNHVRGHLKRIGKPISGVSKSPLCILTELLQDEQERHSVLCALDHTPHLSRPFISQKFAGSEGLFLTPAGVPVKVQRSVRSPEPGRQPARHLSSVDGKRRRSVEDARGIGETLSSTLVDLLKRQRLERELEVPGHSEAARTRMITPRSKSTPPAEIHQELASTCSPEKFEINKKICIHCNATFHSAVSLSNHLRAYARRKRQALLDGTSYDCKQKQSRSQPGPKRKMLPVPHTASDVIYTLSCRFCDLIFQGPQSVQEDWVKHLQRHIMHTGVPGTGVGMVEVTAVCEELRASSLDVLPLTNLTQEFF